MRESIGGAWIFGIVITFIALFSGFLALSINYSKAFQMKDGIVDRIEKYNGVTEDTAKDINAFLKTINYASTGSCAKITGDFFGCNEDGSLTYVSKTTPSNNSNRTKKYRYCIEEIKITSQNAAYTSAYYKVYAFFTIDVPVLNLTNKLKITGETNTLYYPKTVNRDIIYN